MTNHTEKADYRIVHEAPICTVGADNAKCSLCKPDEHGNCAYFKWHPISHEFVITTNNGVPYLKYCSRPDEKEDGTE